MTDEQMGKVLAVLALMRNEWIYAAMDRDGRWFAYTHFPRSNKRTGKWNGHANGAVSDLSDFSLPTDIDWIASRLYR